MLFASGRTDGLGRSDLWMSQRSSSGANDWSPALNLGPTINTADRELAPLLSSDGLELFFTSDRPGGEGSGDLWVSRRLATGAPWSDPENVGPKVNDPAWDYGHVLSPDGRLLLFTSRRPEETNVTGWWMTTRN